MGKNKRFILCDGTNVNSYGFRSSLEGMDLKRFQANPVMLFSHDSEKVIGRWENMAVEDGKLVADAVFDTDDEDAKKIAGKVERGFLKGVSVGLLTDIDDFVVDEDDNIVLMKSELMEASICAIPSDSNAIVLYDKKHTKLSFGDIKLKLNNKKSTNMAEVKELEAKLAEKEARVAELEARVSELEAKVSEAKKNEVEAFLEAKIAEGKLNKEEKEGFAKLAAGDFDTVKAMLDARKPARQTASLAEQIGKTQGQTQKTWDQMDREGSLLKFKQEHPEEYQKMYNEKFGK